MDDEWSIGWGIGDFCIPDSPIVVSSESKLSFAFSGVSVTLDGVGEHWDHTFVFFLNLEGCDLGSEESHCQSDEFHVCSNKIIKIR